MSDFLFDGYLMMKWRN